MKKPVLRLAVATLVAATTPTLAQAPVSKTDRAVMPGSTANPPPPSGGKSNPREGHASTTCATGPGAEAGSLANYYRKVLIHQVEISPEQTSSALSIAPYIEGLTADEGEYLSEAQRCVSVEGIRAAIVLGWCAAISRIHYKIAEIGFDKFNKASVEMAEKSFGRFKPFNKKFQVDSLSELGRIFDTDLLWVLEYLQLIDGNQHQRLRHCFELRNNSAHPGLAPISGENLYSFYSDITKIVLKNDKFALAPVSSR